VEVKAKLAVERTMLVCVCELVAAPISANDQLTLPDPLTDLPVLPIVKVRAVCQVLAVVALPTKAPLKLVAYQSPSIRMFNVVDGVSQATQSPVSLDKAVSLNENPNSFVEPDGTTPHVDTPQDKVDKVKFPLQKISLI